LEPFRPITLLAYIEWQIRSSGNPAHNQEARTEEQALVLCHVEGDGTLTILSNSKDCATRFFNSVFLDIPPSFPARKDWRLKGHWVNDESAVAFFAGAAAGALGWGAKVPQEIEDSMKEALRGIEKRNWKSCVVMCRRALQSLSGFAPKNSRRQLPSGLAALGGT